MTTYSKEYRAQLKGQVDELTARREVLIRKLRDLEDEMYKRTQPLFDAAQKVRQDWYKQFNEDHKADHAELASIVDRLSEAQERVRGLCNHIDEQGALSIEWEEAEDGDLCCYLCGKVWVEE